MENQEFNRRAMLAAGAAGLGVLATEAVAAQAQAQQERGGARREQREQEGRGQGERGSSNQGSLFAEETADADEAQVQQLLKGKGDDASPADLIGTGFTYRHDWGNRRGQHVLRLNLSGANPRSRVFVAIGEGAAGGPDGGKFVGSARYTLHNVAPRAGGVDIWVNIEWSSNIRIYVDYLVVNV